MESLKTTDDAFWNPIAEPAASQAQAMQNGLDRIGARLAELVAGFALTLCILLVAALVYVIGGGLG